MDKPNLAALKRDLASFKVARGVTSTGQRYARSASAPVFDIEAPSAVRVERGVTDAVEQWAKAAHGVEVERRVYNVPGYESAALAA